MDWRECKKCGKHFDFDYEGAVSRFGGVLCDRHDPDKNEDDSVVPADNGATLFTDKEKVQG